MAWMSNYDHYVKGMYRKISNIRPTKSQSLNDSRFVMALQFPKPLKPSYQVEIEEVVGAAPTGDALTTSEWSATSDHIVLY